MIDNYPKAYKEVVEVLKYVPQESVDKIPREMLDMFEENMDKEYFFEVDINKAFEEQILMKETKAILANIFRDYWATPYQKEKIIAKENYDRQKAEDEKRKKYNPDDLFKNNIKMIQDNESKDLLKNDNKIIQDNKSKNLLKNNEKTVQDNELEENSNLPIEIKKEKFYEKLINFIKRLFRIKD